jgi:hypothetical protein
MSLFRSLLGNSSKIRYLFSWNIQERALRSCIVYPRFKNLQKDTPLIEMEVENFNRTEIMNTMTPDQKTELEATDTRNGLETLLDNFDTIDNKYLKEAKVLQITRTGIDVIRIYKDKKSVNDETRVIFIELNSYREKLWADIFNKTKVFGSIFVVISFIFIGYKFGKFVDHAKNMDLSNQATRDELNKIVVKLKNQD